MKLKHTPGPWKAKTVKGHENDLVYCAIESESRAVAFAGVYKEKHNIDGIEAQWNAKLIAAAPELLEALMKVAHMDDDICKCPVCKVAKPIIKKATS
jgi:hypothetical protein